MPESLPRWNTSDASTISSFPAFGGFPYIKTDHAWFGVVMAELMRWEELLTFETFSNYKNQYGPHTQAVVNCFETLDTISWFSQVGAEHPDRAEARVDTWSDAVDPIFHKSGTVYDRDGHLIGPSELIAAFREKKVLKKWVTAAIGAVGPYADYEHYIPGYFEKAEADFMRRYINKYLEHVLIEIISADEHDCTFYREQLTWFEAGHFTCGWVGEWPNGVHRVF